MIPQVLHEICVIIVYFEILSQETSSAPSDWYHYWPFSVAIGDLHNAQSPLQIILSPHTDCVKEFVEEIMIISH